MTRESRESRDEYRNGTLFNGYDYTNQAWVLNGMYVPCGHPSTMNCNCYGTEHAGGLSIAREHHN